MKSCPSVPVDFGAGLASTNALNAYMEINTKIDYHEGSLNTKQRNWKRLK